MSTYCVLGPRPPAFVGTVSCDPLNGFGREILVSAYLLLKNRIEDEKVAFESGL